MINLNRIYDNDKLKIKSVNPPFLESKRWFNMISNSSSVIYASKKIKRGRDSNPRLKATRCNQQPFIKPLP